MKKYLFFLLLFCANIALGQTKKAAADNLSKYKLEKLQRSGEYESYTLDLNNDGLEDKALVNTKHKGQYLYFFLQDNDGNYRCALKTWDFISAPDQELVAFTTSLDDLILIELKEEGSNPIFYSYLLEYKDGTWFLHYSAESQIEPNSSPAKLIRCYTIHQLELPIEAGNTQILSFDAKTNEEREKDCGDLYMHEAIEEYIEIIKHRDDEDDEDENLEYFCDMSMRYYPNDSSKINQFYRAVYFAQQYGHTDDAIYILEQIILNFPAQAEAYYSLAGIYWGLGKEAEAQEYYQRYIILMKQQKQAS